MKLSEAERNHIEEHPLAYQRALIRATLIVKACPQLVGLDKIREPIAVKAALAATGYDGGPFEMPRSSGIPEHATELLAKSLFDQAVAACKEAEATNA